MIYENLKSKKDKLAVIGLGYVGMPIAYEFAKRGISVIGFDLNKTKIDKYKKGIDPTREIGDDIKKTTIDFTSDPTRLKEAKFYIVAVPTPVNADHTPDLLPVESASEILGKNISKGSIVVFESTVYPGVTEETCVPIIEKESGFKCGVDFKIGYSPERINPGDKEHRLNTITKIVSGMDNETLEEVANVYSIVVDAGVYRAESIKVAEAAKVIENSQRDINIAFMNELSIIFHKMNIDTQSVLKAAGTKWNFLKFYPGLVGGHCIGVDPYYLTYKAEKLGYKSQVILSGRNINDNMAYYISSELIRELSADGIIIKNAKIGFFGLTFKENCPDTRNTKVIDIINDLKKNGADVVIVDPVADKEEAKKLYDVDFVNIDNIKGLDAIVLAVSHNEFKKFSPNDILRFYRNDSTKILFDLKGILNKTDFENAGYKYWRM